jgi:GT2 family glycosyltransferase
VERVIVADNASLDATAEVAARAGAEIVTMPENLGYARAANAAAEYGIAPFVAVLNDDLRFDRGLLSALLPAADEATIAIIGPRLHRLDGTIEPSTHGAPTPAKVLLQRMPGLKPWARAAAVTIARLADAVPGQGLLASAWAHDRRTDVEEVCGACLLIRREAWKMLQGFDEQFPFGAEDADLCRRARAAGWRVVFDPRLEVTHLGGQARRRSGETAQQWRAEGWRLYAAKHFGPGRRLLMRALTAGLKRR